MATVQPAWFSDFESANAQNVQISPEVVDGDFRVILNPSPRSRSSSVAVSLASVPTGESIKLTIWYGLGWKFSDLERGTAAVLTVQESNYRGRDTSIHFAKSVGGDVSIDAASSPLLISSDPECAATLSIASGRFKAKPEGVGGVRLRLCGGKLAGGVYGQVDLLEDAGIEPQRDERVRIEELRVARKVALVLSSDATQIEIGRISRLGREMADLALTRDEPQQGRGRTTRRISVSHVQNVSISADASTIIGIKRTAVNVGLVGAIDVEFADQAKASALRFSADHSRVPQLSAKPGAILVDIEGEVVLAGASGAHLAGRYPDGFLISGVRRQGGNSRPVAEEAFVRGFRVPDGLKGRSLLSHLENAHHVEPSVRTLPGWDLRLASRVGEEKTQAALRHDAELMRKLHELARTKGASGAVRTKVGWCSQRLRHATTRGFAERTALLAYRALGYGERPGPPFITWFVLSLAFALLLALKVNGWEVRGHIGWDSASEFLDLWVNQAVSPVGTILGTAGSSGDSANGWLYLVRAVVAVPLLVSLLALRNYVRSAM